MEMLLEWYKCRGGVWCELNKIDLDHKYIRKLEGVYVIWSGRQERKILRVGSGNIRSELTNNKKDLSILAFFHLGVYVSWAEVDSKENNIVTYLTTKLGPTIEVKLPNAQPISVNLPWDVIDEEE
jgi:hypothetical protein